MLRSPTTCPPRTGRWSWRGQLSWPSRSPTPTPGSGVRRTNKLVIHNKCLKTETGLWIFFLHFIYQGCCFGHMKWYYYPFLKSFKLGFYWEKISFVFVSCDGRTQKLQNVLCLFWTSFALVILEGSGISEWRTCVNRCLGGLGVTNSLFICLWLETSETKAIFTQCSGVK